MALESRGKKSYYYRKRRVGQRVISEYVGTGLMGKYAQILDEHERHQSEIERQALRALELREAAIDRQIDDIGAQLAQWVTAELLVAGYHQHKRVWRKRRDRNATASTSRAAPAQENARPGRTSGEA